MGEVVPSHAFFSLFGYFNAFTAYAGFPLNAPKNVFRWRECSFGVGLSRDQVFLFTPPPQKHFSMGWLTLLFFMGVNRKRPFWSVASTRL